MKKLRTLFILTLLTSASLWGQSIHAQLNQVRKGQVMHEKASRPCVQVTVEPEGKAVLGAFQNYLKKQHAVKASGKKPMEATEVKINAISDRKLDLFAQTEKDDSLTVLKVYARLGYDVYLGPGEYIDSYTLMEDMVKDFVGEYLTEYYMEQIKAENKVLAKAQKVEAKHNSALTKLESKNKSAAEKIKSLEEEVADNEKEIKGLEEMLETDEKAVNAADNKLDRLQSKMQNLTR